MEGELKQRSASNFLMTLEGNDVDTVRGEIVVFLNSAADTSNECSKRLQSLQNAEEILLNRRDIDENERSALLHEFVNKVADFALDSDVEIKCFILSFGEELSKRHPEQLPQILDAILFVAKTSEDKIVSKKILQTSVHIYRCCLAYIAREEKSSDELLATWKKLCTLKVLLQEKLGSPSEVVRSLAIKFLESIALAHSIVTRDLSTVKSSASDARLAPHGPDSFSLLDIPKKHSFLRFVDLRHVGEKVVTELICLSQLVFNGKNGDRGECRLTPKNVLVVINAITALSVHRSGFMPTVSRGLLHLYDFFRQTKCISMKETRMLTNCFKSSFLKLMKLTSSLKWHDDFTAVLVTLGAAAQAERAKQVSLLAAVQLSNQRRRKRAGMETAQDSKRQRLVAADTKNLENWPNLKNCVDIRKGFADKMNLQVLIEFVVLGMQFLPSAPSQMKYPSHRSYQPSQALKSLIDTLQVFGATRFKFSTKEAIALVNDCVVPRESTGGNSSSVDNAKNRLCEFESLMLDRVDTVSYDILKARLYQFCSRYGMKPDIPVCKWLSSFLPNLLYAQRISTNEKIDSSNVYLDKDSDVKSQRWNLYCFLYSNLLLSTVHEENIDIYWTSVLTLFEELVSPISGHFQKHKLDYFCFLNLVPRLDFIKIRSLDLNRNDYKEVKKIAETLAEIACSRSAQCIRVDCLKKLLSMAVCSQEATAEMCAKLVARRLCPEASLSPLILAYSRKIANVGVQCCGTTLHNSINLEDIRIRNMMALHIRVCCSYKGFFSELLGLYCSANEVGKNVMVRLVKRIGGCMRTYSDVVKVGYIKKLFNFPDDAIALVKVMLECIIGNSPSDTLIETVDRLHQSISGRNIWPLIYILPGMTHDRITKQFLPKILKENLSIGQAALNKLFAMPTPQFSPITLGEMLKWLLQIQPNTLVEKINVVALVNYCLSDAFGLINDCSGLKFVIEDVAVKTVTPPLLPRLLIQFLVRHPTSVEFVLGVIANLIDRQRAVDKDIVRGLVHCLCMIGSKKALTILSSMPQEHIDKVKEERPSIWRKLSL